MTRNWTKTRFLPSGQPTTVTDFLPENKVRFAMKRFQLSDIVWRAVPDCRRNKPPGCRGGCWRVAALGRAPVTSGICPADCRPPPRKPFLPCAENRQRSPCRQFTASEFRVGFRWNWTGFIVSANRSRRKESRRLSKRLRDVPQPSAVGATSL